MEFLKKNWLGLVAIVLLLMIFFNRSPFGVDPRTVIRDTTHSIDTVYSIQPQIIVQPYTPIADSGKTVVPIIIPPKYEASKEYDSLLRQYTELTKKYLAATTYDDSIPLKDSSGRRVGLVSINDVVGENRILSRTPSYQLEFPTIIKENTITVTNPPKTQLYVGPSIQTTYPLGVSSVMGNLLLHTRKERLYQVGGGLQYNGDKLTPVFGLSTYWKIKL